MKSTLKYGDIIMLYFTDEAEFGAGTFTGTYNYGKMEIKGKGFLASPG